MLRSNPLLVEKKLVETEARLLSADSQQELIGLLQFRESLIKTLLVHKSHFAFYSSYLESIIEEEPAVRKLLEELTQYDPEQTKKEMDGEDNVSELGLAFRRIYSGLHETD